MLLLAFGVAILDRHTRFTHLETETPLLAALGAAVVACRHSSQHQRRGGLWFWRGLVCLYPQSWWFGDWDALCVHNQSFNIVYVLQKSYHYWHNAYASGLHISLLVKYHPQPLLSVIIICHSLSLSRFITSNIGAAARVLIASVLKTTDSYSITNSYVF